MFSIANFKGVQIYTINKRTQMKLSLRNLIIRCAFFGLAAFTYPAAAHHSFAIYDFNQEVLITGTVKEVQWTNPHIAIFVMGTTKASTEPTLWAIEMSSPGNMVRLGWTRTSVKPGDKVTVGIYPLRDGRKGGSLKKITLVDSGQVLNADIRAQERPNLDEPESK